MLKKIMINTLLLVFSISIAFSIPSDPNSFYGEITVNGKEITTGNLVYYLNGDLISSKDIVDSKYGQDYDKLIISGSNGDLIEFEATGNSCFSASNKINYTYIAGEVKILNLSFSGTNTCDEDTTSTTTIITDKKKSSSGGTPSSNSDDTEEIKNVTSEITILETRSKILEVQDNSGDFGTLPESNSDSKDSDNNALDETGDDINVESSKTPIMNENKLSGNILKSTSSTIVGIIILVLIIAVYVILNENKKRKTKTKK